MSDGEERTDEWDFILEETGKKNVLEITQDKFTLGQEKGPLFL